METWVQYLLRNKPQFLLAGHRLQDDHLWGEVFATFWQQYRNYDPEHPVFCEAFDMKACIPYMLHGDEGRGLARKPLMIISWQPLISHRGLGECNDSSLFDPISESFDAVGHRCCFHILVEALPDYAAHVHVHFRALVRQGPLYR